MKIMVLIVSFIILACTQVKPHTSERRSASVAKVVDEIIMLKSMREKKNANLTQQLQIVETASIRYFRLNKPSTTTNEFLVGVNYVQMEGDIKLAISLGRKHSVEAPTAKEEAELKSMRKALSKDLRGHPTWKGDSLEFKVSQLSQEDLDRLFEKFALVNSK